MNTLPKFLNDYVFNYYDKKFLISTYDYLINNEKYYQVVVRDFNDTNLEKRLFDIDDLKSEEEALRIGERFAFYYAFNLQDLIE